MQVDHLAAMRIIAEEHRLLAGPAADDLDPPLSVCLSGFARYFDEHFGVILPLDVSESVPPDVYHESGMCGLTRRCHVIECPNKDDGSDLGSDASAAGGGHDSALNARLHGLRL